MINLFKKQTTGFWILALFALWQFSVLTVQAEQPHDEFIQGYVTALVAMNYPGSVKSIRVDGGVVYIQAEWLSEEEKAELHKMLSDVEGILRVEFVPESQRTEAPSVPPKEFKEPVEPGEHLPTLLPKSPLFQPLLADPRWPHFSVSFQRYINTNELKDVAATNFGESIGLYRLRGPLESTIQLDIQAGVFSIFDLDSQSFDLINADYMVGIPLTIKKDNFANMTRVFHQSSHLGDEYLLRGNSDERINLSYESVNSLFSYHLPAGLRIYAGGGYIFHKDHSPIGPIIQRHFEWIFFTCLLLVFFGVVGIALRQRFKDSRALRTLIAGTGLLITLTVYTGIYSGKLHLDVEGFAMYGMLILFMLLFFILFVVFQIFRSESAAFMLAYNNRIYN